MAPTHLRNEAPEATLRWIAEWADTAADILKNFEAFQEEGTLSDELHLELVRCAENIFAGITYGHPVALLYINKALGVNEDR